MIEVEMLTEKPLYVMHDVGCVTMGKRAKHNRPETHEEARDYYVKMFISEHSLIEWPKFRVTDMECRGDVASHFVRHSKGSPRPAVQSSRPDWNNGESRKALDKTFIGYTEMWDAWSWIHMCRQRLCNRASEIDRAWLRVVLDVMKTSNDPFFEALEMCCVPNCVYRGYCPELKSCGKAPGYKNILNRYSEYKNKQ